MDVWFLLFHIGHLQANVGKLHLILAFILTASWVVRMTFQLKTRNTSNINKHYAISICLNNNNNSDNNFQQWHRTTTGDHVIAITADFQHALKTELFRRSYDNAH